MFLGIFVEEKKNLAVKTTEECEQSRHGVALLILFQTKEKKRA